MSKPHKHAAIIKAWADNPEIPIQYRMNKGRGVWLDLNTDSTRKCPGWYPEMEYRIKPEPKMYRLVTIQTGAVGVVVKPGTRGEQNYLQSVESDVLSGYRKWLTPWLPFPEGEQQ